jgi:hypothetical protein
MSLQTIAAFVCGLLVGGSIVGLAAGAWLAYLRSKYRHLDGALKTIRYMRERGL